MPNLIQVEDPETGQTAVMDLDTRQIVGPGVQQGLRAGMNRLEDFRGEPRRGLLQLEQTGPVNPRTEPLLPDKTTQPVVDYLHGKIEEGAPYYRLEPEVPVSTPEETRQGMMRPLVEEGEYNAEAVMPASERSMAGTRENLKQAVDMVAHPIQFVKGMMALKAGLGDKFEDSMPPSIVQAMHGVPMFNAVLSNPVEADLLKKAGVTKEQSRGIANNFIDEMMNNYGSIEGFKEYAEDNMLWAMMDVVGAIDLAGRGMSGLARAGKVRKVSSLMKKAQDISPERLVKAFGSDFKIPEKTLQSYKASSDVPKPIRSTHLEEGEIPTLESDIPKLKMVDFSEKNPIIKKELDNIAHEVGKEKMNEASRRINAIIKSKKKELVDRIYQKNIVNAEYITKRNGRYILEEADRLATLDSLIRKIKKYFKRQMTEQDIIEIEDLAHDALENMPPSYEYDFGLSDTDPGIYSELKDVNALVDDAIEQTRIQGSQGFVLIQFESRIKDLRKRLGNIFIENVSKAANLEKDTIRKTYRQIMTGEGLPSNLSDEIDEIMGRLDNKDYVYVPKEPFELPRDKYRYLEHPESGSATDIDISHELWKQRSPFIRPRMIEQVEKIAETAAEQLETVKDVVKDANLARDSIKELENFTGPFSLAPAEELEIYANNMASAMRRISDIFSKDQMYKSTADKMDEMVVKAKNSPAQYSKMATLFKKDVDKVLLRMTTEMKGREKQLLGYRELVKDVNSMVLHKGAQKKTGLFPAESRPDFTQYSIDSEKIFVIAKEKVYPYLGDFINKLETELKAIGAEIKDEALQQYANLYKQAGIRTFSSGKSKIDPKTFAGMFATFIARKIAAEKRQQQRINIPPQPVQIPYPSPALRPQMQNYLQPQVKPGPVNPQQKNALLSMINPTYPFLQQNRPA